MTHRSRWLLLACGLLLVLWGTRLIGLDSLPLHNDEGLHLTRAVEVWNLHPFWEISDGKIVNHWPIALLYPQNAPVYAGRLPTVLVSLIGLAAGLALARRRFGTAGALLGGCLWIASPYLFFYERLAFSDAQAGALALAALWAGLRFAEAGRLRDAALTGAALALAALFKFTAAPYALSILVVVLLWGGLPLRRRVEGLLVIGLIGAAAFAVPLGYLILKGDDLSIALGWLGGGGGGALFGGAGANFALLVSQLGGYGSLLWTLTLLAGLVALILGGVRTSPAPRRAGAILLAAALIPPASMILLSSQIEPRHFVVALPAALILGGGALGGWLGRIPRRPIGRGAVAVWSAALLVSLIPFALTAYQSPGELPLPPRTYAQEVADHSAGFGLREAVLAFPETIGPPGAPIIASMFPDSCKRANFYAAPGYTMTCPAAPGEEAIRAALAGGGPVYVLREAPTIGLSDEALAALGQAELLARYPRPDETQETASVTLWRVVP